MKALFRRCARIWTHWTNQKRGLLPCFFYLKIIMFSASMVWIIGEYAERIDNADELLESFLDGFHDENTQVQLQLLTAIVKLFLKRPANTQELVQRVLSLATQVSVLHFNKY